MHLPACRQVDAGQCQTFLLLSFSCETTASPFSRLPDVPVISEGLMTAARHQGASGALHQ